MGASCTSAVTTETVQPLMQLLHQAEGQQRPCWPMLLLVQDRPAAQLSRLFLHLREGVVWCLRYLRQSLRQ